MSATRAAPPDIVRFLLDHPPFDALGADRVRGVADAVELEEHPAGATIIKQGADPVQHLRVVRTGTIEIVHDGIVLDLLGEGELFGHASMLSGLPTGFEARAAEDVSTGDMQDVGADATDVGAHLHQHAREIDHVRL